MRQKIEGDAFASNLERSLLSGPPTFSYETPCALRYALIATDHGLRTTDIERRRDDKRGFENQSRSRLGAD